MLVVVFINSGKQCCSSLYLIGMAHDIDDDDDGENDKLSLSFLFLFFSSTSTFSLCLFSSPDDGDFGGQTAAAEC